MFRKWCRLFRKCSRINRNGSGGWRVVIGGLSVEIMLELRVEKYENIFDE